MAETHGGAETWEATLRAMANIYPHWREACSAGADALAQNTRLRKAVEGALESLEWRARYFPADVGCAVRQQRIYELRAALGEPRP